MDLSRWVETNLTRWLFHGKDMPASSFKLEIALYSILPDRQGKNPGKEIDGGGYSRVILTVGSASFTDPDEEDLNAAVGCRNKVEIKFGQATTPWGLVVGSAVFGENKQLLLVGSLNPAVKIGVGDIFKLDPNDFDFRLV